MSIDVVALLASAGRVLLVGLLFGAGLPALFALGIRLQSAGSGRMDDGTASRRPALTAAAWVIFAFVLAAVIAGVLWITRASLYHHFGIPLFGVGS